MREEKLEILVTKLANCLIDALENESTNDIIAMTGLSESRAGQIKQIVDHCLRSQKGTRIDSLKLFALLQAYAE